MSKYKKLVEAEIKATSKKEMDDMREDLAQRAYKATELLMDTIALNSKEGTTPAVWTLGLVGCICNVLAVAYQDDKDKFGYVFDSTVETLKANKDGIIKEIYG